jgi:AraC-like DNA-binding protein
VAALRSLAGDIRFRYEGGGYAVRRAPLVIPWRQLPYALVESPEGGCWVLETEGRAPRTVQAGEVMVIPRGVRHRFHMAGARVMHTTWFMGRFDGLGGMDVLAAARIPYVLPARAGGRLVPLMRAIGELDEPVRRGSACALAKRQRLGFALLEALFDDAEVREFGAASPDLERLLPALQYVEANLGKVIATADLARHVFLSASRFYAVFRKTMGLTPMAYVQEIRLRQAQHLLLTTSLPVGEVAARAGFASPYYFSRAFRRQLKTTPSAFRQGFSYYHTTGRKAG